MCSDFFACIGSGLLVLILKCLFFQTAMNTFLIMQGPSVVHIVKTTNTNTTELGQCGSEGIEETQTTYLGIF